MPVSRSPFRSGTDQLSARRRLQETSLNFVLASSMLKIRVRKLSSQTDGRLKVGVAKEANPKKEQQRMRHVMVSCDLMRCA